MNDENRITYFAETDARNKRVKFGIKDDDRLRHVYSIGKTGMGKSTMLENMAIQDIQNGNGMAFLDPHGKTADLLLDYIPENRIKDVIYFAPFDTEFPISFNVMEDVGPNKRHLVASGLMSAFEKLFGEESFSDRMQYILQNTILALLEYPGATMLGINRMLSGKAYRNKVVENITDPSVKNYWTKEYAGYTERFAAEAIPAIQNKIGQFTSNPLIRNIIGQPVSSFDIRKVMDDKKILLVNLSKGLVGENNANLLGSMIVTKIYLAAMSRADLSSKELKMLPNFYLYVDEFQSFANKSFADILSEARKYKLSLNITHQYIEQMAEEVRAAVFGNVGTMVSFRVGSFDAEILEKEFAPVFTMEDIVNLGQYQTYLKLMIDGVASQPFSSTTLPPILKPEVSFRRQVLDASRKSFANPKKEVEDAIKDWHTTETVLPKKEKEFVQDRKIESRQNADNGPRMVKKDERGDEKKEIPKLQVQEKKVEPTKNDALAKALQEAMKDRGTNTPARMTQSGGQMPADPSERGRANDTNKNESKEKLKPMPLSELKRDDKDRKKEATPENKNALKEALNKLKSESGDTKIKTENNPKEVPEETLRKVLKGE